MRMVLVDVSPVDQVLGGHRVEVKRAAALHPVGVLAEGAVGAVAGPGMGEAAADMDAVAALLRRIPAPELAIHRPERHLTDQLLAEGVDLIDRDPCAVLDDPLEDSEIGPLVPLTGNELMMANDNPGARARGLARNVRLVVEGKLLGRLDDLDLVGGEVPGPDPGRLAQALDQVLDVPLGRDEEHLLQIGIVQHCDDPVHERGRLAGTHVREDELGPLGCRKCLRQCVLNRGLWGDRRKCRQRDCGDKGPKLVLWDLRAAPGNKLRALEAALPLPVARVLAAHSVRVAGLGRG